MNKLVFTLLVIFYISNLQAQDKTTAIKKIVEAKEYVFYPQTAHPLAMRTINLTPGFHVQVLKDSIIAYLPYYGRAYAAPMSPNETGGIKFTSTKFKYTVTPGKKGGWDILIKPEDVSEIRMLTLTISEEGYTNVHVTSTSRQAISFYGYIKER